MALKTLLSSDATDFERQLLGAAAGERPSPELQLRMQQAIGLVPVALQGPDAGPDASIAGPEVRSGTHVAVKAAASKWAGGTWLKVVLGGAGAGLVAGGLAIRSSEPAPRTAAPLTRASAPAPEQPAQAAPVEATAPRAVVSPAAVSPAAVSPAAVSPAVVSPAVVSPAVVSPAAMSRELREEIDLLDRVRTALDQRDARAASALLESYATRFPEGRLAREATVLRARTAQVARTAR